MNTARITICVLALALGLPGLAAETAPAAENPLITAARVAVEKQEQKLTAVDVESSGQVESLDSKTQTWVLSGKCHLHAVYDGRPGGKCRMEIFSSLTPWTDGPTPFSEEKGVATYNGQIGEVFTSDGPVNAPSNITEGRVMGQRPSEINKAFYTGWSMTLSGIQEEAGGHERFSALIKPGQKDVTLTAISEVLDGVPCVKIIRIDSATYQVFWLDTSHGYALKRRDRYTAGRNAEGKWSLDTPFLLDTQTVGTFLELGDGVYYPASVTSTGYSYPKGAHTLDSRAVTKVTHATIPPEPLKPELFLIQFPKVAVITPILKDGTAVTSMNQTVTVGKVAFVLGKDAGPYQGMEPQLNPNLDAAHTIDGRTAVQQAQQLQKVLDKAQAAAATQSAPALTSPRPPVQ